MTREEIEQLNTEGLIHDDFTPLSTELKKNHIYWTAKKEWYHMENGEKVINSDAPKEAQEDYKEYHKIRNLNMLITMPKELLNNPSCYRENEKGVLIANKGATSEEKKAIETYNKAWDNLDNINVENEDVMKEVERLYHNGKKKEAQAYYMSHKQKKD